MSSSDSHTHEWKTQAREHFAEWADHYDRDIINMLLFKPSYRRVMLELRQMARRGAGKLSVLDVGCGTGTLVMNYLTSHRVVERAAGVDMSEEMLRVAEEKRRYFSPSKPVQFTLGDAEHLPFGTNQFDLVTCCNSFHHYPHPRQALKEMVRVLRPGGRVILIDGCRDEPFGYFIFEVCVARAEKGVHHCTAGEFRELMQVAGFRAIRQQVFGVCPPVIANIAEVAK